jgi:hypothetical protein
MSQLFNKFNVFVLDLAHKVHNLGSDSLMVLLTNTAPNPADTVVDTTTTPCTVKSTSNAVEIAAGNGYTKGGGAAAFASDGQVSGTYKLVLTSPAVWTATPAALATFRYAVIYNNTAGAAATRPVVGWYDYGSSITPQPNETFTLTLDGTNGVLTLA